MNRRSIGTIGRMGALACAAKLGPEGRTARAKAMANARWAKYRAEKATAAATLEGAPDSESPPAPHDSGLEPDALDAEE